MTLNAITLEIIRGGLLAAQAECEALLERTAMSPVIREKQDYFIGFYDGVGALVTGTKLRLFGDVLRPILARFPIEEIEPEDIFCYKDCYFSRGGVSHLPDMVFVMPVFADGELIAFAEAWGHLWDIGGIVPGSISPQAIRTFQEGIIRDVRVLADNADLGIRLDNCKLPAFGANGGLCRQTGRVIVNPDSDDAYELKTTSDRNSLKKNDLLRIITPGGSGWGNPLLRPTERVLDDVLDGFISVAAAARDYGVILDAEGLVVDDAVTEAARAELAGEPGMFQRGEFFGGPAGQTLLAAE